MDKRDLEGLKHEIVGHRAIKADPFGVPVEHHTEVTNNSQSV
jgi:hypothetical protein